ncbi:enoyl-CoA hydratase [Maritimibacter sp. 55A14]|uniref:enoyl-CoA hydratase/isomerase family protein n=1 Tax=Maritimibacter sp. 55A14 TaxID=2174844 RepID=UPI000D614089|nr:enoyl-CoA hydratase/isomerase family protein [Maritimibacter sp. 55A14]PWE32635.1 enoyl-CoA hydratase [Maritimibacter sp. 55A14]
MIRLDKGAARWTLTLDRSDKANSLTRDMMESLDAHVAGAAEAGIRVLVLTGAGRVFSAGADLEEARAGLATDAVWERLSARIAALPCLTVAALNGTLAGGAFGMALACDLRVAVEGARFFYPVMKLGFLPQPSDPGRMVALMGPARAKLVLAGGAKLTAAEALAFGLVDRVTAADGLTAEVDALAADAEAGKADVLGAIKRLCTP